MGNREIEDSLERLDKLTQEEARMASAEQLKMMHNLDGKVMGVDDRVRGVEGQVEGVRSDVQDVRVDVQDVHVDVQDVRIDVQDVRVDVQDVRVDVQDVRVDVQDVHVDVQDVRIDVQDVHVDVQDVRVDVQDVGNKVQDVGDSVQGVDSNVRAVGDKLDQANRSLSFQTPDRHPAGSDSFTGNQLRDSLLRWLSPPNPSVNHNIARKAHHDGTTQWFFEGSIFNQWKSTVSFLWVHGKRVLFLTFTMRRPLIISHFYSGFRKKCCLVRPSPTLSTLVRMTLLFQFLNYTRYHGFARCWDGHNGLLLLRFQGRR
jgi:hypothetical protein